MNAFAINDAWFASMCPGKPAPERAAHSKRAELELHFPVDNWDVLEARLGRATAELRESDGYDGQR